jgi:prepilin peptidase CpaA
MDLYLLLFFPGLMAFAAVSDLLTMTIPNRVSLLLIAGFFIMAILVKMPLPDIGMHILSGLLVLIVTFGMFAMGWMGGGDAKLAAATGLWLGFGFTLLEYLLVASMLGGGLTLLILNARGYLLPNFMAKVGWIARLHDQKTGIPYGIALAAAALLVYPSSGLWRAFVQVTV